MDLEKLLKSGTKSKNEIAKALATSALSWFEGAAEDVRTELWRILKNLVTAKGQGDEKRVASLQAQLRGLMRVHKLRLKNQGIDVLIDVVGGFIL